MSYLLPPPTDQFPKLPALPTPQPATPVVGDPQPPSNTPAATADRTRRIVSIMSHRGQLSGIEDQSPDPAEVIAAVIRFATRRGRRLSALPTSIRVELDSLCDAGDPAVLVVRDWLECKLPQPISEALAEAGDVATKGRV